MLTATTTLYSPEIPSELWMRIFAFTITRPGEEHLDLPEPHIGLPPLLLGRVSRRWREVSLSCSELWSTLGIRVADDSLERGVLDGMERWLARAGDRPLDLAYCGDGAPDAIGNAFLRRVLWKRLPQTRSLLIRMAGGWDDPTWLAPPVLDALPLLEAIQLMSRRKGFARWITPIFSARLPALRRLIMTGSVRVHDQIKLPLEQDLVRLTHLNIATNNFDRHPCWILQHCRDLVSCSLAFGSRVSYKNPQTFDGEVVLQRLRVLHLREFQPEYWVDVFAVSTFPALQDLEINGDIWPLQSIIPFLTRSRCMLRTLRFLNSNISKDAFISVLRAPQVNTHLERLEVSVDPRMDGPPFQPLPMSDALIRALNPSLTTQVLLPRLQIIEVNGMWASGLPWCDGTFADMVVARCHDATGTVARLKRVSLFANEGDMLPFHVNDFEVLRTLRKTDLHVVLLPDLDR